MERIVHCIKLDKDLPGLEAPPYPGELGQRIFENVSQIAWADWLNHQTMLINEYRLSMLDASSRQMLATEMEKFFFGEGSVKPSGFVPTSKMT